MRKTIISILFIAIVIICLVACSTSNEISESLSETPQHVHSFGEWTITKAATCTESGEQERICSCGEKETQPIAAVGHTVVVDAAVAATCTETGLTEGSHCSVCDEIIVAQETIPAIGPPEWEPIFD